MNPNLESHRFTVRGLAFLTAVVLFAALLLDATSARAGSPMVVWLDGQDLHVRTAPALDSRLRITYPTEDPTMVDIVDDKLHLHAAQLPCKDAGNGHAFCPRSSFTRVFIELGDGADQALNATEVSSFVDAGSGDDQVGSDSIGGVMNLGPGNDVASGRGYRIIGGPGTDTALISSSRTAPARVTLDNLANDGQANEHANIAEDIENLVSGEGDDVLIGSNASNRIDGGRGNDTIDGRGGNDVLVGDIGSDTAIGGAGTDSVTYSTRNTAVVVTLDNQANDGVPGETDNVRTDVENVLGGAGNDTLIGNSASNILRGLAGNDSLNGLGGNDSLEGGSGRDSLFGNTGVDTATYLTHPVGIALTLDNKANDGRSNEADNVHTDIENVTGSNHNDTIVGSPTNNILRGGAGNDRLFGRAGNDTLVGDSGTDQGFGDQGRDTCTTERRTSCP